MKHAVPLGMAILLALGAAAGPACAQAPQTSEAAPEIKEVQKLADRWTAAYNGGNRAALGSLYTDDAKLYVHGSPTVSGRRGIETYWADDMKVDSPITVLRVTHAVDGIDMKLVHGDYQVLNRQTGVPLGNGRFAHIWTRISGGQWLLDRDLWNQPYK